jgi:hypothetical protein
MRTNSQRDSCLLEIPSADTHPVRIHLELNRVVHAVQRRRVQERPNRSALVFPVCESELACVRGLLAR